MCKPFWCADSAFFGCLYPGVAQLDHLVVLFPWLCILNILLAITRLPIPYIFSYIYWWSCFRLQKKQVNEWLSLYFTLHFRLSRHFTLHFRLSRHFTLHFLSSEGSKQGHCLHSRTQCSVDSRVVRTAQWSKHSHGAMGASEEAAASGHFPPYRTLGSSYLPFGVSWLIYLCFKFGNEIWFLESFIIIESMGEEQFQTSGAWVLLLWVNFCATGLVTWD